MQTHYVIGEGKLVTTLGFHKWMPAVFIKPACNPYAVPGQPITEGVDAMESNMLEEGEIVFTFPSEERRDRFYAGLFSEDVVATMLLGHQNNEVNWENDVMEPGIAFATRPKLSESSGETLDVKK